MRSQFSHIPHFLAPELPVCRTAIWNQTITVIAGIGTRGAGPTQLNDPLDAKFDANGTLFVADTTNNRIQKYTNHSLTGTTLSNLTLSSPTAIYIKNTNLIYILDSGNYRVQQWNNTIVVTVAGGNGSGTTPNKIGQSYGLYVDNDDNIYISEHTNHRVTKWLKENRAAGIVVSHITSHQLLHICERAFPNF